MSEDATFGYYEYDDLGPECSVCLSPIEDALTHNTKYHVDCGIEYRRAYHRLRARATRQVGRRLTVEELDRVRHIARQEAATEVAAKMHGDETML